MYSTRYDNLDRGGIKSAPLGITHINADNSLVHVTVLLSDSNTPSALYNHFVAVGFRCGAGAALSDADIDAAAGAVVVAGAG